MKCAVIYARVSTSKQADGDLSIPDQLRACTNYCQQHNLQVVGQYIDLGLSATDDNRPELQRMVEHAVRRTGGFEVIVLHSQSRFFRDNFQAEMYRRRLLKVGVEVVSITQDFGTGPHADLMRQFIGLMDEYFSKENAKHVLRGMEENARQGFVNGIAPFGYQSVVVEMRGIKAKRKFKIQPEEADTVRVIWELAKLSLTSADPIGVRAIADELDRRKLRTRSGRSFSTTDVHNILHNPVYIGRYIYNVTDSKTGKKKPPDRWHIIPVEPIVDETTFEAVHAAMRERDPMRVAERYAASPMLLSKLARHHKCGGSMTLGMGTGNGGRYRYYECSKRRKIPGSCSGHRIGEILLDNLVLGYLANVLLEPMRLQALLKEVIKAERVEQNKAPRELDALLRRKSDLDGRIGRMHKAIEVGTVNYEERDFRERLDDLKGHRVQVEIQISSLRSGPAQFPKLTTDKVGALATELRFALLNGDLKERRNYLHLFLSRVIVKDHEIELVGNKHVLAQAYAEDWQSPAQKAGDLKRRLGAVHAQVQGGSAISEERIECVGNVGRVHRPRVRRIDRIEYGRAHGLGMQCDQCRGDGRAVGFSVDVPALESKRPPHPSKSATVTLVPKSFSSTPRAVDPAWHAA